MRLRRLQLSSQSGVRAVPVLQIAGRTKECHPSTYSSARYPKGTNSSEFCSQFWARWSSWSCSAFGGRARGDGHGRHGRSEETTQPARAHRHPAGPDLRQDLPQLHLAIDLSLRLSEHTPQPAKKARSDQRNRAGQSPQVTNDHPRSRLIFVGTPQDETEHSAASLRRCFSITTDRRSTISSRRSPRRKRSRCTG